MSHLGDVLKVKTLRAWAVAALNPPETKELYTTGDFLIAFTPLAALVCAFLYLYLPNVDFLPVLRGF